jgi:hypothetical protein
MDKLKTYRLDEATHAQIDTLAATYGSRRKVIEAALVALKESVGDGSGSIAFEVSETRPEYIAKMRVAPNDEPFSREERDEALRMAEAAAVTTRNFNKVHVGHGDGHIETRAVTPPSRIAEAQKLRNEAEPFRGPLDKPKDKKR